jgi:hypothetical protein
MPIKKVTFSFDVPITQLLSLIATGNAGMKIDVYGDDAPQRVKRLNGHGPKLLEGPKPTPRKRGEKTGYRAMFDLFATDKDRTFGPADLQPALTDIGLSPKSVSPQLTKLRQDGNVRRVADGKYQITSKGLSIHAKLIATETLEAAS